MKRIKNKKVISLLVMFIISIGIIIFTFNNHYLYKDSIMKVTKIDTKEYKNEETKETYYKQIIHGKIINDKYKGKEITIENNATYSGVYDEYIHDTSELFLDINEDNISISGIKRDKYIAILLVIFINLMICIGNIKGFKTIISLIINIILSLCVIYYYQIYFNNLNILLIFIPLSIIFIIISLLITNNKDKKTLSAIISAVISLLVSFSISYIILSIYKESISYWHMNYIEAMRDYENIFYINILLCGLGAIMDIAITMSSSLNEIINKNKKISLKNLKKSGREISKDIVGTMINVMLFTIYSNIIPMGVLAVRNNISLATIISTFGEIEMIRVLTSSIAIVLAIPISFYISIYILKIKGGQK